MYTWHSSCFVPSQCRGGFNQYSVKTRMIYHWYKQWNLTQQVSNDIAFIFHQFDDSLQRLQIKIRQIEMSYKWIHGCRTCEYLEFINWQYWWWSFLITVTKFGLNLHNICSNQQYIYIYIYCWHFIHNHLWNFVVTAAGNQSPHILFENTCKQRVFTALDLISMRNDVWSVLIYDSPKSVHWCYIWFGEFIKQMAFIPSLLPICKLHSLL